jgi:homoserine kinase type II
VIAPETAHADADRYLQAAAHGHTPFDRNVVTLLTERKRLIDMYAHQRPITDEPAGPVGWTHGDLQHRNILWGGHRVAAVLDWDRIRIRPFAEEIVRTATIQFGSERARLDLSRAGAFIRGYRTVIAIDDADLADGLHRLWWKRMADFWHLDFHYDRNDSSCDALFLSGEAFLRWWTEYRDAVLHALLAPHGGRGSETAGAPFIEAGGVLPAR